VGNGTYDFVTYPTKIKEDVIKVYTGPNITMAITSCDTLWAWGDNSVGQLAASAVQRSSRPIRIIDNVADASLNIGHVLIIKNDGSLWGWGTMTFLGIGIPTDEVIAADELANPYPVKIMENVIAVATGQAHSLALTYDGSLWAWGRNVEGQLGYDGNDFIHHPMKIKENVIAIAAGENYSAAITSEYNLYTWGANSVGQLGNGSFENRNLPEKVMDNVKYVFAGRSNMIAITNDGIIWGWGGNVFDQLQIGHRILQGVSQPTIIFDEVLFDLK
jgi:alpha-tubulin suppressor-like RCC1 family protein